MLLNLLKQTDMLEKSAESYGGFPGKTYMQTKSCKYFQGTAALHQPPSSLEKLIHGLPPSKTKTRSQPQQDEASPVVVPPHTPAVLTN